MGKTFVVVGGGIFGLSAAVTLRQRGHNVTLVDPGPLPHPLASSTDVSKLIRPDYGSDEFYMRLMEDCLKRWPTFTEQFAKYEDRKEFGGDGLSDKVYHATGLLSLRRIESVEADKAHYASKAGHFLGTGVEKESYNLLSKRGHVPGALHEDMIRQRYPGWDARHYPIGYFNRLAGWAESGRVVYRLALGAKALGVTIIQDAMKALVFDNAKRVVGIFTESNRRISADKVIVAAGAWTSVLLPHLSHIMKPTGHVVMWFRVPAKLMPLFTPPLFPAYAADVARTGFYGFPAIPTPSNLVAEHPGDGILKIGNHGVGIPLLELTPGHPTSSPLVGERLQAALASVREREEQRFRDFVKSSFPALTDQPIVFSRLCMYNDTFDLDFVIDNDPSFPGLVIATGGSGHGFKFAPLLGDIIADSAEDVENPYHRRFAFRVPGGGQRMGDEFRATTPISVKQHIRASL